MSFVLSKIAAKLVGPSILWIQQTTITGSLLDLLFFLLFSILVIFGGKRGRRRWWVKVGPKKRTLDPSRFYKNCNFWNIIQTLFFKLNYYLWWKCQQNQIIFMGVKPKKHQKRAISWILNHYTKRSKFLTWQTSNAIVMKLTTTVYFQKTFNLVKI